MKNPFSAKEIKPDMNIQNKASSNVNEQVFDACFEIEDEEIDEDNYKNSGTKNRESAF